MKTTKLSVFAAWAVVLMSVTWCHAQNNQPPAITAQPVNVIIGQGSNATFNVAATGTQPLHYQWQFNGTNLAPSAKIYYSGGSVTLEQVSNVNAGPYDVVITNLWGGVTSSVVTLTVAVPPLITRQPAGQVVSNSGPVSFSVGATGLGPFTYQWLFNGHLIPNNLITTVAGDGTNAYAGDGGAATNASLNRPAGVALDANGNLFIADTFNNRIHRVDADGLITTVAGNGNAGYNGNALVATNASLSQPAGVAVDADGNWIIADTANYRVRVVAYDFLITVAGSGGEGYSGDGGPAYNAALNRPGGVAVDAWGNIYVADTFNHRIRKVDVNDNITTVAGNGSSGYHGDGGAATNTSLYYPYGVAVDAAGNLFIADTDNNRLRKVDTNGIITTVAGVGYAGYNGDGLVAANAYLNHPTGVAVDAYGNLFIADSSNQRLRKVTTAGLITTVAGHGVEGFAGDGGTATNAFLNEPEGVAVDANGDLFIADSDNNRIRKVTPQGPGLTLANVNVSNAGNYQVIISSTWGSVTSSVAVLTVDLPPLITLQPTNQLIVNGGNVKFIAGAIGPPPLVCQWQFNGTNLTDGGNLYGSGATNLMLTGVTTNNAGAYDLIVSDAWGSVTSSVAVLTITFPPTVTSEPVGQTIVYGSNATFSVGVSGTGPFTYQWLLNGTNLPGAIITTVAGNYNLGGDFSGDGGPATNAGLYATYGVAVGPDGSLFIADTDNQRIRKVDTHGIITTVAGNGLTGYSGDGGAATNASFYQPNQVMADAFGNLFISDTYNQRIRKVDTNGIITTVAGNGSLTPAMAGRPSMLACIIPTA